MSFLDWCYGVLVTPKKTFAAMKEEPPIFYSFLVVVGVSVLQTISSLMGTSHQDIEQIIPDLGGLDIPIDQIMGQFGIIVGFFGLLFTLFWWFLGSAVYHLLSELLGGKGAGLAVMSALGLSILPLVLVVPLNILAIIIPAVQMVVTLIIFVLTLYVYLVLPVLALESIHDISRGRAIGIVLLPMISCFAIIILGFIMMVTAFSSLIPTGINL